MIQHKWSLRVCLLVLVMLLLTLGFPAIAQDTAPNRPLSVEEQTLLTRAQAGTPVRVIVVLNTTFWPEGDLNDTQVQAQRSGIDRAKNRVTGLLAASGAAITQTYSTVPLVAATVDAATLQQLVTLPEVAGVYEDQIRFLSLAESTPLIGATTAWAEGYEGTGQAVAVLDTGVQNNHPFMAGRVVSEACFSTIDAASQLTSACANGATEQFGTGAAAPCTAGGCYHGTHVAGTAAGRGTTYSGVARDSQIIAVNIASVYNNWLACLIGYGTFTCVGLVDSDIIAGLEHVYSLRNTYSIAAVNMSLGGGRFYGQCSGSPYEPAINNLHSAGIAVVAASGNNGYKDSIAAPACLENVVSVGATCTPDAAAGSYCPGQANTERVASFSNSAAVLDLLAPGVAITASVPNSQYGSLDGTSMAAPHVAGAFAVLREAAPEASVEEILAALQLTGVPLTDSNNITVPRIQIDAAIDALLDDPQPVYNVVLNEIHTADKQAIELYNADDEPANLTGWRLQAVSNTGATEIDYAFPNNFTLPVGGYVTLYHGAGTNTNTMLYMGIYTTTWAAGGSGAARLTNGQLSIDFVRWGGSTTAPGVGESWSVTNPTLPPAGQTLGRDELSTDGDAASDWLPNLPSLGSVNTPVRPPNDNYANAADITALPYTQIINTRTATLETGESTPANCTDASGIGRTVWYRLQSATAQGIIASTANTAFDTVLAVYRVDGSTLTPIICNDDENNAGGIRTSRVAFTAAANAVYLIQAGGWAGENGLLNIAVSSSNDDFDGPRTITALPYTDTRSTTAATVASDDPTPACSISGARNRTVWYRYTAPANTTLRLSTQGSNFDTVLSVYTGARGALTSVACSDDYETLSFSYSRLDLNVTGGTTYHVMVSAAMLSSGGNLVLNVTDLNPAPTLTLAAPTGTITNGYGDPAYSWSTISGATAYELVVAKSDGSTLFTLPNIAAVTYCGGGTCTVQPIDLLGEAARLPANGLYRAYVRVSGGVWFGPFSFTLNAAAPAVPTLGTPTNTHTLRPTVPFTLDGGAANMTWFRVVLSPAVSAWFTRVQLCGSATSTTCSFTPNVDLVNGTAYTFWVRGYGPGGYAIGGTDGWVSQAFTVQTPLPPVLAAPTGTITDGYGNPTYTWNVVEHATAYELAVAKPDGSTLFHLANLSAAANCTETTCTVQPIDVAGEAARLPANGLYKAYLRVVGGSWSAAYPFTLNAAAPAVPTLGTPTNTNTLRPTVPFTLDGTAANMTWFRVLLSPVVSTWFTRAQLCGSVTSTTCSFTPNVDLVNGTAYTFWVRSYGPGGYAVGGTDGWVSQAFTVNTVTDLLPAAVTDLSATVADGSVTVRWAHAANATGYALWLGAPGGGQTFAALTLTADALGCAAAGETCTFTATLDAVGLLPGAQVSIGVQSTGAAGALMTGGTYGNGYVVAGPYAVP